jgi:hypothetical protein
MEWLRFVLFGVAVKWVRFGNFFLSAKRACKRENVWISRGFSRFWGLRRTRK